MNFQDILVEIEPPIAIIKLNRPEKMNAVRRRTIVELTKALKSLEKNSEVRALILTGEGKAFSAGADIEEMVGFTPARAKSFSSAAHKLIEYLEGYPKPVVAAVNGHARATGLDLAVSCDVVISSEQATFGWTMINVGLISGSGGDGRALRILGVRRGKSALLRAMTFNAVEASELGLVDEVVPSGSLIERCKEIALELAEKPPKPYAVMKKMLRDAAALPLRQADKREITYYSSLFRTGDTKEALRAFLEKRKPRIRKK